jgi:hypothetical protein
MEFQNIICLGDSLTEGLLLWKLNKAEREYYSYSIRLK